MNMPPSSRKRNKGKDRKAKKRIEMYNTWQNWARGESKNLFSGSRQVLEVKPCNHGLVPVLPEESHPVSRFISDYFSEDIDLRDMLQRHPEVQNDDNYRKMAADILIRIETNWLLEGKTFGANFSKGIMILENYGKTCNYDSTIYRRDIATMERELGKSTSNRRDYLKFYRKRISCSCLKEMHLEARKTFPKLGVCEYCGEMKERRLLMVCSRCMVDQYCSRRCQVSASSVHRSACDNFVRAHERTMAND